MLLWTTAKLIHPKFVKPKELLTPPETLCANAKLVIVIIFMFVLIILYQNSSNFVTQSRDCYLVLFLLTLHFFVIYLHFHVWRSIGDFLLVGSSARSDLLSNYLSNYLSISSRIPYQFPYSYYYWIFSIGSLLVFNSPCLHI